MKDITKDEIDDLSAAMTNGFGSLHDTLTDIKQTQYKHGEILDHMAARLDEMWTENAAQTIHNRRVEVRIARLEEHLGLTANDETLIAA